MSPAGSRLLAPLLGGLTEDVRYQNRGVKQKGRRRPGAGRQAGERDGSKEGTERAWCPAREQGGERAPWRARVSDGPTGKGGKQKPKGAPTSGKRAILPRMALLRVTPPAVATHGIRLRMTSQLY